MLAAGPVCCAQAETSLDVWHVAFNQADQFLAQKDYAGARDVLAAALKSSPPSSPNSSDPTLALLRIGSLDLDLGAFREAEKAYLKALTMWDKPIPPQLDRSLPVMGLQMVYTRMGEMSKAERFARQALQIRRETLGPDDIELGPPLQNLAAVYQTLHRYSEARDLFRQAIDLFDRAGASQSRGMAAARGNLAMLLADQGDFDGAIHESEEGVSIWRGIADRYGPQLAIALNVLADIECRAKRWAEAQEPIREAQEIELRLFGKRHPMLAPVLRTYADVMEHTGHKREAKEMLRNADEIDRESALVNLTGHTVDAETYRDRRLPAR